MDSAERFYRQLDKMQGLYPQLTFRRAIQEVQRAFEEAMGHVPSTLVEAIFLRFLDSFNQASLSEQSFIEYSYRLGPYIDVFWRRYDPTDDPISKEEWLFLKEAVSESAGDLDLGLLTYVMQILMEKGLI